MEAVFKIDALKGCASKEDTCAHFKADIQASVDAESSGSTSTVSLDKCKYFLKILNKDSIRCLTALTLIV